MRTLYLGDIHKNFNIFSQYVNFYSIKNANIIQVGDFGVGFKQFQKEKKELEAINKVLAKNNVFVWAIRGNHDYKPYFDNDPFNLTNIKLVKDYTVLNLGGKNILCIGGAISIDRKQCYTPNQAKGDFTTKTGNEKWWPDEIFDYDDNKLKDLRGIDIIVTHTAPDYCIPDNSYGFGDFVNSYIKFDPGLKLELLEERRNMTLAFQTVKENNDITHHYYGHYHRSGYIDMYGTRHRVLGIGELHEEREEILPGM